MIYLRKKVKLAFIVHDDSSRKATFNKRKKGLLKKMRELSIFSGVPVGVVICGKNESKPEVRLPSSVSVHKDQESFILQRIAMGKEQLKKQREDNREREIAHAMLDISMSDLNDLEVVIGPMMSQVCQMQETLSEEGPKEVMEIWK
ncbi:agamous-like MADS-box protein AGL80 [Punica granatum]|uniref:Agamous-like MADS-box protein AGL80 n=1 Tax=Punica granatum TaxID=22663 RepID=A0A6P8E6M0_PUNGR|nr:agamous-like MADS-box protein AGL80 [Punica granatum]